MTAARGTPFIVVLFLLLFLLLLADAKPAAPAKSDKTSLAFVIDNSKSMKTDVSRLANWATAVLPTKSSALQKRFDHFTVATFNAKTASPAVVTKKAEVLVQALKMLQADGSVTCNRKLLSGILNTAKVVKDGAVVLVLTDGLPGESEMLAEVLKIVKSHSLRLIFAMTGCCKRIPCAGKRFEMLGQLAKASKGVVYRIGLADVQQIVKMITEGGYKKSGLPTTYTALLKKNLEKNHGEISPVLPDIIRDKNFKFMTSVCESYGPKKPQERFTKGCTIYECTKNGVQIVEERCDANQDGWDCRIVSDVWKCNNKGIRSKCTCIRDKLGVLIKID